MYENFLFPISAILSFLLYVWAAGIASVLGAVKDGRHGAPFP
jgi:hypothetical protein